MFSRAESNGDGGPQQMKNKKKDKKKNKKKNDGGDSANDSVWSRDGADTDPRERGPGPKDDGDAEDAAAVVKRSVKTSGIEDVDGGPKN